MANAPAWAGVCARCSLQCGSFGTVRLKDNGTQDCKTLGDRGWKPPTSNGRTTQRPSQQAAALVPSDDPLYDGSPSPTRQHTHIPYASGLGWGLKSRFCGKMNVFHTHHVDVQARRMTLSRGIASQLP